MKIKLTAHIHFRKYRWDEKGEYQIFYAALLNDDTLTYICEQKVEVEVPDNYDLRSQQVMALEKQVAEINNRIKNLLALEHTA